MISNLGLIDGITGSLVVILGIVFGLFFLYEGIIKKARMLKELAFVSIFAGLLYFGVLLDFTSLLITGKNFPNNYGQVALFSYIWFPPTMWVAIHLAVSIQYPDKAWYAVVPYVIFGIIFYILIFMDPLGSFYFGHYEENTPRLIDYNISLSTTAGRFIVYMLLPVVIIFGFGLIYQSQKTTGELRKKFLVMSAGAFCYGIAGMFEAFVQPGIGVIIVRMVYLSSFWLIFYGLKPIKERKE